MNKHYTCSFTGHRKLDFTTFTDLDNQLATTIRRLVQQGYTCFCSGGALGFDLLAAEAVIRLKEEFPAIQLCMILPCRNQDRFWNDTQKAEYYAVLNNADEIIYTSDVYHQGCMFKRNRTLVDSSSHLLAYLDDENGGTKYTIDYAAQTGINPEYLSLEPLIASCQITSSQIN